MKIQRRGVIVIVLVLILVISPVLVNAGQKNLKVNPNTTNTLSFDMIIIAPSSYSSALESFIQHKNSCDINTKFISVDDIYSGAYFEVQGRDNQEKIKYFIKDAIETWDITYVLFVGSFTQIPVRYCYNNDGYSASPEPKFVSELYYADIYDGDYEFSSWDSDGDGIYGEWDGEVAEDKPIDLTPDVCLGRLACIDAGEVKTVTSKIINYEKQPADSSWFKRLVVVGGDTYAEFEGYEGEIYNQQAIDAMNGFNPVKLWASTGKLTNGWGVIREINRGCGFWYLSGHGNANIWVTRAPDGSSVGKLDAFRLFFLFNRHKLPVCLVGGCHNTDFTKPFVKSLSIFRLFTWMKECWSWQLVSKSNGGSIATIGATGLAWYGVEYGGSGTDWLNVQFFKEYSDETEVIGQIWKNALTEYMDNFPIDWETPSGGMHSINAKTVQEWTLLGDPSLTIGGDTIKPFKMDI